MTILALLRRAASRLSGFIFRHWHAKRIATELHLTRAALLRLQRDHETQTAAYRRTLQRFAALRDIMTEVSARAGRGVLADFSGADREGKIKLAALQCVQRTLEDALADPTDIATVSALAHFVPADAPADTMGPPNWSERAPALPQQKA